MAHRGLHEMPSINGTAESQPLLEGAGDGAHLNEDQQLQQDLALINQTDPERGLSAQEVQVRRDEYGFNELPEKEVNMFLKFLSYFWGPMPIMIWLAIIIELIKGASTGDGWEDFGVLMVLQLVNGVVGFVEEKNAGNAIAALKEQLAPKCFVKRAGSWQKIPARELVPGDLIQVKLGDIVPADAVLLGAGKESLDVDQAALTGESLPVTIYHHEKVKMSSTVKRGELDAVVCATGPNTFLGRAAGMMAGVETTSRFQKILFKITLGLLAVSLVLCAIIFVALVITSDKSLTIHHSDGPNCDIKSVQGGGKWLRAISVVVVLLVASIPIAMQVVCTSTMAVGSRRLAQKKVIVARLGAIEELAGMTVLCSDKTGTLTKNQLELRPPILMSDMDEREIFFYSALSAKRVRGNQDAIDFCITEKVYSFGQDQARRFDAFTELDFHPFNPTDKRTEATILSPEVDDGSGTKARHIFQVTKGAPQVVLRMCVNDPNSAYTEEQKRELDQRVSTSIQELADRGFRALGVAIKYSTGPIDTQELSNNTYGGWEFQGLLSLFDPPRDDTKHTIAEAVDGGVEVKMITGDQTAIAKETCRELGMGTNILNTDVLREHKEDKERLDDIIMSSNGFAEVMPEDKFDIVNAIRKKGFVVGMTGDGVNDAPALKRADIGIAVEGATDAAKAASDIVLTEPGLSVIIDAIQRSRKIFQRMRNYSIYRIACTIELLFFFFFAVLTLPPSSDNFFGDNQQYIPHADNTNPPVDPETLPNAHFDSFILPVIALVVITILNDGTIITIAYDKVIPEKRPQSWDLREVTIVSTVLGLVACLGSLILLLVLMKASPYQAGEHGAYWVGRLFGSNGHHYVTFGEVQTIVYLKISLSDFMTVFCARTRSWLWERRPGYALAAAFFVATGSSTLFSLFWPFEDKAHSQCSFEGNDPLEPAFMAGLEHSKYAVILTWVYCIISFFVQDAAKVLCYWVMARMRVSQEERLNKIRGQAKLASMAHDYDRAQRRAGGYSKEASLMGREVSLYGEGGRPAVSAAEVASLLDRVATLEKELRTMKSGGSGAANGGI